MAFGFEFVDAVEEFVLVDGAGDGCDEAGFVEGFGEEVEGTESDGADGEVCGAGCGGEDDGDGGAGDAELLEDAQAVGFSELPVEDDGVDVAALEPGEEILGVVGDFGAEGPSAEHELDELAEHGVVVDDEDFGVLIHGIWQVGDEQHEGGGSKLRTKV